MKKYLLLMAVFLEGLSSSALGTIYIYDGQVHNYYSYTTITQLVEVDLSDPGVGVPGAGTVINSYGAHWGSLRGWEDSQINIYSGHVSNLSNYDRSILHVYGGDIPTLYVGSYAEISDGTIGYLQTWGLTYLSGGQISAGIYTHVSGTTFIYGEDFAIDGNPVPYGEYFSMTGNAVEYEPSRQLTGTLANGDILDIPFRIGETAKIVLVPEPVSLLFLAGGTLLFLRRKSA